MITAIIPIERIAQAIFVIRAQKVMLSQDLAALYGVAVKALNQAVKRHAARFPADFVFQLTSDEFDNIAIMRAFVKLHRILKTSRDLARKFSDLERRVGKHDEEIAGIIEAIRQLMAPAEKPRREIGFHVREKTPRYRVRKR
ncbi:MAG TPA: ORF6N domain-containing protein [Candidatus Binatus sp.]|nr:ORF6N domain-containing protein [Candidatus Binatus sp.]